MANKKTIDKVNELLEFLRQCNVNYISPEGLAYLDGLKFTGYEFESVSKKEYDELLVLYDKASDNVSRLKLDYEILVGTFDDLKAKYDKLNSKKSKWNLF